MPAAPSAGHTAGDIAFACAKLWLHIGGWCRQLHVQLSPYTAELWDTRSQLFHAQGYIQSSGLRALTRSATEPSVITGGETVEQLEVRAHPGHFNSIPSAVQSVALRGSTQEPSLRSVVSEHAGGFTHGCRRVQGPGTIRMRARAHRTMHASNSIMPNVKVCGCTKRARMRPRCSGSARRRRRWSSTGTRMTRRAWCRSLCSTAGRLW